MIQLFYNAIISQMKIIKQYECSLTIDNPLDLYSDLDLVCLNLLQRYEGRCYKGSLILKILKILRRSKCYINKNLLDGSGQIEVVFTAEAIVYTRGEVIVGAIVQNIDRSRRSILSTEYGGISMLIPRQLQGVKVGQRINIQVGSVKYPLLREKIAINGRPYLLPEYDKHIYSVDFGSLSTEGKEAIKAKISAVEKEEKLTNAVDKKLWKFFVDLHYPFKKKRIVSGAKNMMKLFVNPSGKMNLSRPPAIVKPGSNVLVFKKVPARLEEFVIIEDPAIVAVRFLHDYQEHLRIVREMCDLFKDKKIRESYKNIWKLYEKLKT